VTDKILLTVVVTVYNLEEYLPRTLESVLSIPAELPYEVIAVDDGSKDRSPEILREWEATHDRLRVIIQPNSGASGARNTGIEAAKGKYITFIDGDDTILPEFFPEAVREAEENGFDIVEGNIRYVTGETLRFRAPDCERCESAETPQLMEWFFGRTETLTFNSTSKLFRLDMVGETRFNPEYRIGEDMKFDFEILLKKPKVLITGKDAYNYIDRDASVLHSQYVERGWDAIRVLDSFEEVEGFTDTPRVRMQLKKLKTDVLVKIYNTAVLTGKNPEKVRAELKKYNVKEFSEALSKKELLKIVLLQRSSVLYNLLLKIVKN
jgi:glycosyltransferase involved in cell wall biosynthesis